MKFLRKYYSQIMFLIIGFIIGFFITRLPIKFEEKTNWVSLASFFLTILLAIYLEFIVRPSFSNNRSEKDILIDQLKDIRLEVSNLQSSYINVRDQTPLKPESKQELIAKLRGISNLIDLLKQTDEYCSITRQTEISENIFKEYLAYKKSLTGYKFDKATFYFDRLYWNKCENAYKNLMKATIHSVIDINKA